MSQDTEHHNKSQENMNDIIRSRREKLDALLAAGENPFEVFSYDKTHSSKQVAEHFDELEGKQARLAGRLISKRVMGKASFAHVLDNEGTIQIYAKRDVLGEEAYARFKKLDIGDIIGFSGEVFKTHMGEISIVAESITLLAKSLLPLPEKFHGLKDQDLRYRQRHVDLMVNPEVRQTFITRSKVISGIRQFMDARGFLEVDTPVLHSHATNAAAKPFKTHHNTLDIDMFLRVETELYLKRLIIGGFERVYEIGRIFRNEGMDTRHNPEFTSIEAYQAYTDYKGMMELAESLIRHIADNIAGQRTVEYQGIELDFQSSYARMTMVESVKKYSGVDFDEFECDDKAAKSVARQHHLEVNEDSTWGSLLNEFFEAYVEEKLVQPTFIYDYPIEISPLAKRKPDKMHITERFELFVVGRELANAFSELNDPLDQRERFIQQAKLKYGDEDYTIDEDFISAMEYGMPPAGGIGIGVDRLIMIFTDAPSIRDVLLFPTMKPKD